MQFIVNGINMKVKTNDKEALFCFRKKYNLDSQAQVFIHKKSIDARKKSDIKLVYSFLIKTEDKKLQKKLSSQKNVSIHTEKKTEIIFGNEELKGRPVIVGAGPAGLFCGYYLAKYGYSPVILERGEKIEDRTKTVNFFQNGGKLNVNSNVQFGEGGAGAFSDGKLTTRISDPICRDIIKILAEASGIKELEYSAHPHIGTDKLKECVINLRNEIIKMGGEFRFSDKFTDFQVENSNVVAVKSEGMGKIPCNVLVLASGHSARDIYELMYKKNISLCQKSFSVGVRVEHFKKDIDKMQYGDFAPDLPSAEYQVFHHLNDGHTAYSFCMCPGGTVVASQSEENSIVVNGMSEFKRNGKNSNSAICISVSPSDFGSGIFDGLNFTKALEEKAYKMSGSYKAPFMTLSDFLGTKCESEIPEPTYPLGVKEVNFDELFPTFVAEGLKTGFKAFEFSKKGFASLGAVLTAPETRTSAPLRILRNDMRESPDVKGLYPCGEGAGYAGGIVSAAVDGAKTAIAIMKKYKSGK